MVQGNSSSHGQECHLMTGGGGYVGSNLCRALLDKGHKVVLLDVQPPDWEVPNGVQFVKVRSYGEAGNIREIKNVYGTEKRKLQTAK